MLPTNFLANQLGPLLSSQDKLWVRGRAAVEVDTCLCVSRMMLLFLLFNLSFLFILFLKVFRDSKLRHVKVGYRMILLVALVCAVFLCLL